jgi:hypothetical protein
MKIVYAITVCNEFNEIQKLINFLLKHKRSNDAIIVLYDYKNGDKEIELFLRSHSINGEFNWYKEDFNNDFAEWKNKLISYCDGNDYIFQIDADEIPNEYLISILPTILESNPEVDVYLTPRVNTVEGITKEHIQKWGWVVDGKGWINYPDYQWRIWKNKPEIKWINKVHERLDGHKTFVTLPSQEEFSLYHPKTIERQEKQNNYYNTL